MNCSVNIGGHSYPGFFIAQRGTVFDVQMAGPAGYNSVMQLMNAPGSIQIRTTGVAHNFAVLVGFDAATFTLNFQ